ncbi:MAG: hypothetical protein PHI68_00565 [Candidatus Cloacimonetes bacterium]|nr:hypothetical protein [Candidatus Cloacimonadota bacterium]
MKKLFITLMIVLPAVMLLAVFDDYQPSARARGMGNAYTAYSPDANALFYNPAGLTQTDTEVKLGFSNLANQKFTEFKTAAASIMLPKKMGTLGLGVRMFDVDFEEHNLISEQNFSLGYAKVLQEDIHSTISVGLSANYFRLVFDEDEEGSNFGLDLGALAILHQRTRLGFSITNINQPTLGDENQHDIPRKMALGISYVPYDKVVTSIEVKKDFAKETEFMGGVEARLFDPLAIRVGVHQNPATYSAGASFYLAGIEVDYSYTYHAVLEGTHYINIGYIIQGR